MPLLRKDIKVGLLAGGGLVAAGLGYMLVAGTGGSQTAQAGEGVDPLGSPIDAVASTANEGESFTLDSLSAAESTDDGWGVFEEPVVTSLPKAGETSFDNPLDGAEEPEPANLNTQPSIFADSAASDFEEPGQSSPAPASGGGTQHVVQSGDSFSTIANLYYGDSNLFDLIRRANPTIDSRRLKIGQVVIVPARGELPAVQANEPTAPATAATGSTHTVRAGETLSRIASDRLGSSQRWQDIYDLNRDTIGGNPAALKVGMVLRLPS